MQGPYRIHTPGMGDALWRCTDCKVVFWLGKAVFRGEDTLSAVDHFQRGEPLEPPNWTRETLNRVLWKMLAAHSGHTLRVLFDYAIEKLEEGGGPQLAGWARSRE